MKVSDNMLVSLTYDLNVGEGEERELMEKATAESPLVFLFGQGMMLQAFEENLKDMKQGDKFSFTLTPEQAYGEFEEEHVVELPKNIFEVDGKFDSERVVKDAVIPMMDSNGNRLNGVVEEILDNVVVMDFNHPLAGETLHFSGEILDVHEPTAEELAAFAGGCGGGCGDGCDCGDANAQKGGCGCGDCN